MQPCRICLNMIVKNEAEVIRRCLDSVSPYIDTWVIVDTGSTDSTQNIIRQYFQDKGIAGELHERPWKDFGTNRAEALDLARTTQAEYTLFIDADEVFTMPSGQRWEGLTADAYQILHLYGNTECTFWLTQLVRNDKPWRWEGVVHEALYCSEPHTNERLPGPTTRGMFDSARNKIEPAQKYRADALILEAALAKEPNHARYVFYLGQSWRDANEPEKALEAYRRRSTMGGWEEEVWYAQFQVGRLLEKLSRRAEAIEAYLLAYNIRPRRAETLCELARMHREAGAHPLAHLFSSPAKDLPRPDDILFLDESVYRWRALDEYSIACYWIDDFAESLRVTEQLLSGHYLPEAQRPRVEKNREFALAKVK
jgi:glycosyltransferase involved in cell wall biosynthesis